MMAGPSLPGVRGPAAGGRVDWLRSAVAVACAAGLLMLGATAFMRERAASLREAPSTVSSKVPRGEAGRPGPDADVLAAAPPYPMHTEDVAMLLRIADARSLHVTSVNYRSEPVDGVPAVARLVQMHVDDGYPNLKAFVAEALGRIPHLYLEEIRIDQGGAPPERVQASLKLSLLYKVASP